MKQICNLFTIIVSFFLAAMVLHIIQSLFIKQNQNIGAFYTMDGADRFKDIFCVPGAVLEFYL
jgi:hypothetical protein